MSLNLSQKQRVKKVLQGLINSNYNSISLRTEEKLNTKKDEPKI